MSAMSADELRALPAAVSLATAARALGCGRTLAYELARRDQFPCRVLRVGTRYLVPTADLLHLLGITSEAASQQRPPDEGRTNPRTRSPAAVQISGG